MRLPRHLTALVVLTVLATAAAVGACTDDPSAGPSVDPAFPDATPGRPDTGVADSSSSDAAAADAGADADADAAPASCGNGTVQAGEACDLGAALNTGAYGGCNANCTKAPSCGDGIKNGPAGVEDCDKGAANSAIGACSTTCKDTSLLLWLDATDPNGNGVLPADNTPLAAWVDKARGRAVVQATAGLQPTWRAVGINNKPSFELDGVDDFFDVDLDINGTVLPDLTVVVVFQNASTNPVDQLFAGLWGHDDGDWDRFLVTGGNSGVSGVSNGTDFVGVTNLVNELVPLLATTTMRSNLVDMSTVHLNGDATTFTGSINAGATHMSIGSVNGPGTTASTHAFDGYIAEMRIYGEALSDANRMALETALKAKYFP